MELSEIQCMGPFPIYALTTFTLNVCSNQHGKVSLTGTIEKQYEKSVITCKDDAVKFIIKDKAGEEKILFCGVIHSIELKHMKDVCVLTMEVMSHTIQLDKQKKRRSFQDQNLSYETLLKNIVQKEYQGDLLDSLTQGKKIESFLLQYDETDWEFFKRIISRLNGVLFPEICAQSPKIYVGLPNPGEKSIDITHDKTLSLDFTQSAWTKANEQRGTELDHIKQSIRSQSEYPLGTNLIYEGKPFTITEQTIHGDIQVQGGYLERTYTLQPRGGCYINHYYQENDTGLHLQGKVLEVDQDRFRVHLDIDEKQDPNTAYWFPIHSDYVANQHTGQYIMPEKGSVVYLYFPNRKEEEASIRAVRRIDGETNAKTQDPDTKYISNATGKHWKMDKRSLNIVIEEGHFFIEQDASKGIQIKSNQAIQITSEQDIQFQAPSVHLTAKEEISLEGKNSSLILDNETHFKSSKVSELGIPVPVMYQERMMPKKQTKSQKESGQEPATKNGKIVTMGAQTPVRRLSNQSARFKLPIPNEKKKENKNKSKTTSKPRNPTVVRKKENLLDKLLHTKNNFSGKTKVLYGQHYTKGKNGRKELKPNIEYTAPNGYKYQTDSKGRISSVEGMLKNQTAKRNVYAQKVVGREDRKKGDEGGHLIASIFDGSGNLDNLVPMRRNLNRGDWRSMENTWKSALKKGQKVQVEIKINYSGASQRPISFDVRYKIGKNVWKTEKFKN